ncbi:hypothetical protein UK82_12690 [Frankia sp. ACN1ag]|nr:hypothetical protein UK82_12690 [Frankia sp. ACN1ag]
MLAPGALRERVDVGGTVRRNGFGDIFNAAAGRWKPVGPPSAAGCPRPCISLDDRPLDDRPRHVGGDGCVPLVVGAARPVDGAMPGPAQGRRGPYRNDGISQG